MNRGYYDIGFDPETQRYGVPADKHPDYKPVIKELRRLVKEAKADADQHMAAVMAVPYPREKDDCDGKVGYSGGWNHTKDCPSHIAYEEAVNVIIHDPEYEARTRERNALMRSIALPAIRSNLYREPWTGSLAVRYDRAGKYAWEAELKRLGRK